MDDSKIYERIGQELAGAAMDPAVWARAIALANGDEGSAKVAYARMRYEALRDGHAVEASPMMDDASAIELLAATGKRTLYGALGVSPAASQEEIGRASEAARARLRSGERAGDAAILAYAIDTLGDQEARRRYDRSLLRGASAPGLVAPRVQSVQRARWGSPWTVALLVASAAIGVSALLLVHRHEAEKLEIERQRTALESARIEHGAANDAARTLNDASIARQVIGRYEMVMADAVRLEERRLRIAERAEERKREELAYRAAASRGNRDQTRRVVDQQVRQVDWQRERVEQERARVLAEREAERQRTQLIGIYLGRNQFLLARDVARGPEELNRIEQAEAAERARLEAAERQRAALAAEEERRRALSATVQTGRYATSPNWQRRWH